MNTLSCLSIVKRGNDGNRILSFDHHTSKTNLRKCLNCDEFWGCLENNFMCTNCCGEPNIKPILPIVRKITLEEIGRIVKDLGYIKCPDNIFNMFISTIKKPQCKFDIRMREDMLKSFRHLYKQLANQTILFSDEQAIELSKLYTNYSYHQFIVKNKLYPWTNMELGLIHNSAYCYFGNFGEIPEYKDQIKRLLDYNMNAKLFSY